jgi:prevent-host-death family protein
MKLSSSIKPISYLKAHTSELINKLSADQTPLVITQNGEAKAVVQDIASYEQTQESLAMLKMIAQSQQNISEGKVHISRKTFKSLRLQLRGEK